MAAKYIFSGNNQLTGLVSKLSGTTKNMTTGIIQDPQKIENIISMVRTVVPLTSTQTVSKVNTYLPLFEKVSTLLGMYSFLNRAQTFRPIEPLNAKSPTDMMSALMKNGSIPMGKMLAQPLISNNMEKMMGSMAMNMMKNGGLNNLLQNGNISDLLQNGNINDMLSSFTGSSGKNTTDSSNIDLSSLMETFMPLINSMNTDNSSNDVNDHVKDDRSFKNNYDNTTNTIDLKNENYLQDTNDSDHEPQVYEDPEDNYSYDESYDRYDKYEMPKNERYDRNYKNERYDYNQKAENSNEHKNNYNDKKEIQRPIRIKQRKRR